MKTNPDNPVHVKVLAALCMPQYVWRTAGGVARDADLSYARALACLEALDHDVVIHEGRTSCGEILFAERQHLIASQTWRERLSAAFRNRVY